jgi:hypothetical protein
LSGLPYIRACGGDAPGTSPACTPSPRLHAQPPLLMCVNRSHELAVASRCRGGTCTLGIEHLQHHTSRAASPSPPTGARSTNAIYQTYSTQPCIVTCCTYTSCYTSVGAWGSPYASGCIGLVALGWVYCLPIEATRPMGTVASFLSSAAARGPLIHCMHTQSIQNPLGTHK